MEKLYALKSKMARNSILLMLRHEIEFEWHAGLVCAKYI
jgi:hypothetical protein